MSIQASARPLWDYKVLVLTHGLMGWHKGELDRAAFEASLDPLV